MEHLRQEVRVDAPAEHVWKFLCDTSHWEDWMPRGKASDFSGPYDQVGTTYVSKFRMMGFEMKQTNKVVEVEPLRLIHEHTDDGPMETFIRFEPEGGATRVIMESDYEMPGYIPGFVKSVWTKNFFERQTQHILQDFKTFAEASVPVPA